MFYLLLQYGNVLVSKFFALGSVYGLRSADKDILWISIFFLCIRRFAASLPGSTGAFVLGLCLHTQYLVTRHFCTYHHCCDDPRCRCILSFGLACSQIGIGTMGSCRDFVPALFCSHRVAWVQLSWLHYGVLKSIGHGNDSKPGPSMARNRCYRLLSVT